MKQETAAPAGAGWRRDDSPCLFYEFIESENECGPPEGGRCEEFILIFFHSK